MNATTLIQYIGAAGGLVASAVIGAWVANKQRKQQESTDFMDAILKDNTALREENARLRQEVNEQRPHRRTRGTASE